MKKIINGKTLNTATAKLVGSWSNNMSRRDFAYTCEDLYRNSKGTWFLYGEGGPMSPYTKSSGQNSWSGDERLIPMTDEEARTWAEEKLSADEYQAAFGETEEASPSDLTTRSRVGVVLDTELYEALKAHSESTGIPVSRLLDRAIKETYKL